MENKSQKIRFSIYSDYDRLIVEKASKLGLPLIGGTALEVLASYYGKEKVRQRSNNDIDFITNSNAQMSEFKLWVRENTDPNKVQVDLYFVNSHKIPIDLIINANNLLVMAPEYIIWSKLQRFNERDKIDIAWLLSLCAADELEKCLSELGITEQELEKLNIIIKESFS